jgi:hypothetical protein
MALWAALFPAILFSLSNRPQARPGMRTVFSRAKKPCFSTTILIGAIWTERSAFGHYLHDRLGWIFCGLSDLCAVPGKTQQ